MVRSRRKRGAVTAVDSVLQTPETSLLDVVDKLLNKGAVANGDVALGVAGVDLIYLRLSALVCAADRVLPTARAPRRRRGGGPLGRSRS